ncbi:fimbrial biogenesis chaperone [Enterobacter hormaechei]|uniref:fimbrial biogenesis chaperone n=1 Tax=Enterobacter hormaechei TaxID=158836 RepID=UPI0026E181DD|nr:fimbria/pilus periplasmic chaperone [Enterobacter hormaechei]MDO6168689.1 fimbria/pilus periplasmic chaperone [Enterobacter hormaechei]MDO6172972.1 fimbria/pilus periplasmic chaperone [Enterobacter hormaechei]
MNKLRKILTCFLFFISLSPHVKAGIVITGTRVIYPSGEREVMVKLNNTGNKPVLMQAWIDDGDSTKGPDSAEAPFTITPPVNRIDPQKGQTLKISFTGEKLPEDRESVFWLNILEIPPQSTSEGNNLQMAFRSRIKLFYRPSALAGKSYEATDKVKWKREGDGVTGYNNSAYYISVATIAADADGKKIISDGGMIPPEGKKHFKLSEFSQKIYPVYINDYGANKITPSIVN